jgi:hypothetical protein
MGKIERLGRELYSAWGDNLTINTSPRNPHREEVCEMLSDRDFCHFLRKSFNLN